MLSEEISSYLKQELSSEIFSHCAGVAETARILAYKLGCDPGRAELAGWLHDCARHLSPGELLALAKENHIEIDGFASRHPVLLHAPLGVVIAKRLGCTDNEVLAAIRYHTLGTPGMSLTGRIVYLADKIEPGRNYPGVGSLRTQAEANFQAGLLAAAAQTINNTTRKKQAIHPLTFAFWNWLVDIL